jgi:hypothetical protein
MTSHRQLVPILCLLLCAFAHGQSNLVNEAASRGLNVRTVPAPKMRNMTPAEWRRRQLAAADKSQQIMLDAQKQPGLLGQYLRMQAGYDGNDEVAFRMVFGQYLSWFQTWLGDYDAARAMFSIAQPAQADDAPSPLGAGYHVRAADEEILRLAKDRKAVFFNEAHSAPVTRTLTVELLARLRAQGFDYFAAETLYTTDKDLGKRGYPTASSGFYVAEPIYGEMVRQAIRLGFKIIAYDAESNGSGEAREKASAEALYEQTFKRDPNARLVLNAGFGHIQKSGEHLGGSSMAEYFQKVSGIEPLAIEQTMLIEHAHADQDHPWYAAAIRAPHPDRPFVFVDDTGNPWTLKPGKYDVSIFFPPEVKADGRPTWPSLGGARKPWPISADLCRVTFPCLIEARYAAEGDDAIPADRFVLEGLEAHASTGAPGLDHRERSVLYLYPGRYRLRAVDRADRALASSTIDVGAAPANDAKVENR